MIIPITDAGDLIPTIKEGPIHSPPKERQLFNQLADDSAMKAQDYIRQKRLICWFCYYRRPWPIGKR